MINERVRLLNDKPANNDGKYILYWMQMFKRTTHNHALNFAVRQANERKLPLVVYEGLKFYYPWANDRIHTFILEGVAEKRRAFEQLGIRYVFYLQKDDNSPKQTVARIAKDAVLLVTDDFPCFIIPGHNKTIAEKANIPVYAVDSNGIIPLSKFEKEEYAAYTIRPKIKKLLPHYIKVFNHHYLIDDSENSIVKDKYLISDDENSIVKDGNLIVEDENLISQSEDLIIRADNLIVDCPETIVSDDEIENLVNECDVDHSVKPSRIYKGGSINAHKRLQFFVKEILPNYNVSRNKPEVDGSSRLSSYLHFGFISAFEIAAAVRNADVPQESKDAYLEELIVRRELSYNFTSHNPNYDSLEALPPWVQQTMREHIDDIRSIIYSLEELENANTHDELWNAAQCEMIQTGEMHNYVRMLWGKNVIAWTKSYEEAFAILEHLNNKYCLDGRNPNSYAGILWCFGKHDRPWMEREIFGKMRYMTSNSTGKKFDAKRYIEWTKTL